MHIERTFVLDTALQRAWAFLNEPDEVGRCLPGCHTVEIVAPGKYKATVGIKVGQIKAGFDVEVETLEERPPEYAAYSMRGADKGGGSKISAECTLSLRSLDEAHTEVSYTSHANIVGKLGRFAGGVMQKFSDHINDQFIAALIKRVHELESGSADASSETAEKKGGWLKSLFSKKQETESTQQ